MIMAAPHIDWNAAKLEPLEDWFLQDPMLEYIGPIEMPVVPWKYHKILNPRYNLREQALSVPEQIEKYGHVYQRVSYDYIMEENVVINGVATAIYYVLYEMI